jgi:diguanylate cyclase (GGDEF)-like protein
VNDTLGHPAGDAVLRGVADRMRAVVRARERPFRYGGEEFAVILYGADADAAARIGERLRRAVASARHDVGLEAPLTTTCSVGVASLPEHAHDADSLVAAADAALLRAKAHGKDRVEAA